MKTIACVAALALICLLSTSEAARSSGPAEVDPSSPDKCVWTESGKRTLHPVGSSWKTGGCAETRCVRRNNKLYVETAGCGVVRVDPPCRIGTIDPSKPYPQCCPKPTCPTN